MNCSIWHESISWSLSPLSNGRQPCEACPSYFKGVVICMQTAVESRAANMLQVHNWSIDEALIFAWMGWTLIGELRYQNTEVCTRVWVHLHTFQYYDDLWVNQKARAWNRKIWEMCVKLMQLETALNEPHKFQKSHQLTVNWGLFWDLWHYFWRNSQTVPP